MSWKLERSWSHQDGGDQSHFIKVERTQDPCRDHWRCSGTDAWCYWGRNHVLKKKVHVTGSPPFTLDFLAWNSFFFSPGFRKSFFHFLSPGKTHKRLYICIYIIKLMQLVIVNHQTFHSSSIVLFWFAIRTALKFDSSPPPEKSQLEDDPFLLGPDNHGGERWKKIQGVLGKPLVTQGVKNIPENSCTKLYGQEIQPNHSETAPVSFQRWER